MTFVRTARLAAISGVLLLTIFFSSVLLAASSVPLAAGILGFDDPADAFAPSPPLGLGDAGDGTAPPAPPASVTSPEPPAPPPLFDTKTKIATGAVLVGAPIVGYFAWWRSTSRSNFESANERWFQRDTYAGGADKASHIFVGYATTLALQTAYRSFDKTPAESRGLALGVMALTGALVELGDGYSQYGFSWEDLASNAIGSLLATGLDAWDLKDTVGLRFGYVKALKPDACCRYGGYGDDYSKEIYSADLKLAGFLPRLGLRSGFARFFLVSMTYGSKGYRYSGDAVRERNLGVEVGLNLREALLALGVPERKWWGKGLLAIGTFVRLPYTSFGWHYDLNHGKWNGPDTGDRFDPGSVLYE